MLVIIKNGDHRCVETIYTGLGNVIYDKFRVIAEIDREIARYYLSLIPKSKCVCPQMYPPHITIVRSPPKEIVPIEKRDKWGKWEEHKVLFGYDGRIQYRKPYFYLNVWSPKIGKIRKELGLPKHRNGFSCYHITLGNIKE